MYLHKKRIRNDVTIRDSQDCTKDFTLQREMERPLEIRQKECSLKESVVTPNKTYNEDTHETQETRKHLINIVPYGQNRL